MKKILILLAGFFCWILLAHLFSWPITAQERPPLKYFSTNVCYMRGGAFNTITAAKNAAGPGDTIYVMPGTYTENNLLKAGVNYYFFPGAKIVYVDPVTGGPGYGIFDDRAIGATTNRIYGALDFYWSSGTNAFAGYTGNTNAIGAVVLTNANSDLVFEFHTGDGESWENENPWVQVVGPVGLDVYSAPNLIFIEQCRRCEIRGNELLSSKGDQRPTINSVLRNSVLSGVYWVDGEVYVKIPHIGSYGSTGGDTIACYGVWSEGLNPASLHNLWLDCDLCESILYWANGTAPNMRTWAYVKNLSVTNSVNAMAYLSAGGKNYLFSEKIEDRDTLGNSICIKVTQGEAWVTAQKLTVGGTGGTSFGTWAYVDGTAVAATLHLTASHYEMTSATNVGFVCKGANALLEVTGGEATFNGLGISHQGGRSIFKNVGIYTASGNFAGNYPAQASASGLTLQGCRLFAPALCVDSINAGSAQNVGVIGSVANVTKNANVTLSPNGGFTVDSNVR